MKRIVLAVLVSIVFFAANAMHIQIGASGRKRIANQWFSGSVEIGATSGTLSSQVSAACQETDNGEYFDCILPLGTNLWSKTFYVWFVPGGGLSLYAATAPAFYALQGGAKRFTAAETVPLGTFGYTSLYANYAWDHAVVTIRGNPYSTVLNDTDTDRTVNGTLIPAGESRLLPFPIYLVMDEIENVKFYDLESGDEITCYIPEGENDIYWSGNYYCPSWTGDIRFSDGTSKAANIPPAEPLVFGDMAVTNADKILYAQNDMPIYADGKVVATNIQLQTWWDFDNSAWGNTPKAYINNVCVCPGHTTSHIIAYTVSTEGMKVYGGTGYVDFTMRQTPQSGYVGGSCTMRCWDATIGSTTSAYARTPSGHKAEVSAGTGTAKFRLKVDINTGAWSVYPL